MSIVKPFAQIFTQVFGQVFGQAPDQIFSQAFGHAFFQTFGQIFDQTFFQRVIPGFRATGATRSVFYGLLGMACLLAAIPAAAAQPAKDICFQHNVRGTITIKKKCVKLKGKHDAFFTYECAGEKTGRLKRFDPGNRWEELDDGSPGCREIGWGRGGVPDAPAPEPVPKKTPVPFMEGVEK